jgi:tetratricopeptide (TPR) repeat protein
VQRDKLRFLESKFAPEWGGMGAVAEAFGLAYGQAKDSAKAIEWYRVAVNSADGSASFRAAEQLGNELARCGEKLKDNAAARAMIEEGISELGKLVALQTTVERESLLGSAWKRLVLLEARAGRDAASLKALEKMATHYANAEVLACRAEAGNLYYPAKNSISAELRLAFLSAHAPRLTEARLSVVRASLDKAATERPDFWSVVGQTELSLLEALAQRRLAGSVPALLHAFRELKERVPSSSGWDSVYTEARFTLEPYQTVTSGGEQRAAAEILSGLKALAAT